MCEKLFKALWVTPYHEYECDKRDIPSEKVKGRNLVLAIKV